MTDKAHIFFKEGKLYLIPELPVKPIKRYQQEYEQAKANALPVVNPEQSDIVEHLPIIRKEGKLYEWPGTWEKVYGIDFGGNDFAFGTGAKLIAPQQNTAHGYTEGAEVPQQAQADKANEGREEKELAEINKLHVSLSNEELIKKCNGWVSSLAKTGGKSWLLHIPVNFNEDPDMLFTELSARFNNGLVKESMLRDQLSKERKKYNDLLASIQRHFQTLIARNYNNIGVWSNERQDYNFQLIKEIEDFLKEHNTKATELDKN